MIAASERKILEGQQMRADGWSMLEEACRDMRISELPQVLRGVVRAERPVVKREVKVEGDVEEVKMDMAAGGEEAKASTSTHDASPITQSLGNPKYMYKCPFCDFTPSTSKSAVDCHKEGAHKRALILHAVRFFYIQLRLFGPT